MCQARLLLDSEIAKGGSEQPYRGKPEEVISELAKDGKHTFSPGLPHGRTSDTTRNLHAPGVQVGTRPFLCQLDEAWVETCPEDLVQQLGALSHDDLETTLLEGTGSG